MKELKKQFRAKDDFVHGDSDSINQVLRSSLKYGTKIKKIKICHSCIALNFRLTIMLRRRLYLKVLSL